MALWALTLPLAAQKNMGELRVSVKDATGAPLTAIVRIENQAAKIRQEIHLPADGRFAFRNLPFGHYAVTASREGFTSASEIVELHSEVPLQRTITLAIQAVSSSIEVNTSDTLVDAERASGTYYVGSQEIRERSIDAPGRGLVDLTVQQPGWTFEANGILHPRESEYETQYVINGFPVQENRSPAFAPNVESEDVQSMKIYTSGFPAEFGEKMGGVIELTTDQNVSPGFHGTAVLQGGSFNTFGGYLSGQYSTGKTTVSASGNGFLTDRYLDPAVIPNYTNHGSSGAFDLSFERDLTEADRIRFAASQRVVHFLVPDELLQYAAGTREDRDSIETAGQFSWQHVISPAAVASVRAMFREESADLWSNSLTTPIAPRQNRQYNESYGNATLAGHHGRHDWKAGVEVRYGSIHEDFGYHLVAYRIGNVRLFDRDTPADFSFMGHALDREQSGYIQDQIHFGQLTATVGLRFDHYSLLVNEHGFSPRVALAYNIAPIGLVLHASYDRSFATPPFENILVSASPQAAALNDASIYLPLRPSRGNYYEFGLAKGFGGHIRLDASYFLRDIHNFQDDDLLENTGVSFPIEFNRARIRGLEAKLTVPRWGRFSGFLSYANTRGIAEFPIAGGLFLEDGAQAELTDNSRFPVSQDQRNTARANLRYQIAPRVWTSWKASYNSGLPTEIDESNTYAFLVSQYGQEVVSKVNFDRGRVNPWFSLDASLGIDVWKHEKRSATVQVDALNLTDRLNVINFAGFLSGTAIAPPRSYGARLRYDF